jgi:hypothetical protein
MAVIIESGQIIHPILYKLLTNHHHKISKATITPVIAKMDNGPIMNVLIYKINCSSLKNTDVNNTSCGV